MATLIGIRGFSEKKKITGSLKYTHCGSPSRIGRRNWGQLLVKKKKYIVYMHTFLKNEFKYYELKSIFTFLEKQRF